MLQEYYELRVYDPFGAYKFTLQDVISLDYSRKFNDLGVATIVLSGNNYDINDFSRDDRLEIYRYSGGRKQLVGQTCWFLRKQEIDIVNVKNTTLTLTFYDTIHLLTRRYVAWSGRLDVGYVSHLLQTYDSMLYLIMYFNFGAGTTSEILYISDLAVNVPSQNLTDLNGGVGSTIYTWQFLPYGTTASDLVNRRFPIQLGTPVNQSTLFGTQRFEQLSCLKAMQDIANVSNLLGEKLYFDILYFPATPNSNAAFEFKTWVGIRGADRTVAPDIYLVGPEYGNFVNAVLVRDWEKEATIAYMAGNGQDENKIYASARRDGIFHSPFYPIEIFGSESFGDDTLGIQNPSEGIAAAQILLSENQAIETLTGKIINTGTLDFFNNIQPYDKVISAYKDFQAAIFLDEYDVSVDDTGENITIPL